MAESTLSAAAMSAAIHTDPQFAPPTLPRLIPGLVRVPTAYGLIVDGGPSRQSFTGRSAATALPAVMDALDGTSDLAQLSTILEMPQEHVDQFLALLYTTGMLEDAATDVPESDATNGFDPEARIFLTRSLDTTRAHRSFSQLRESVHQAPLAVHGDGPWTRELNDQLTAEGFTVVPGHDGPEGTGVDTRSHRNACVVLVLQNAADVRRADQWLDHGWHVLPVRPEFRALTVGPLLEPAAAPCPSCAVDCPRFEFSEAANNGRGLLVPLVVRHLMAHVGRIGTTRSRMDRVRIDLETWQTDNFPVAFAPNCARCAAVTPPRRASHEVPVAHAFETSVAFPARKYCDPAGHQMHYKSSNIALQQDSIVWPAAPVEQVSCVTPNAASGWCNRDTVTDLIRRSTGQRPGSQSTGKHVQRYAPTGGNLGSPQAYLVARDVPGLQPGVYGYQSDENSLARLTWLTGQEPELGGTVPATVILTGGLAKVGGKYGAFAWRIVHLDAGAATAQMMMLADHHRVNLALAPTWDDDRILESLSLDDREEVITAVIHLDHAVEQEDQR
ncbi:hypothetical protein [Kocuria sp.]|uniref:hypothetical protein n=1 Tax=Kocuria sp. TaxID=1871328 RepID=UPI00289B8AF7|nr:hypothetical protein [Kocuria sp.]